MNYQKLFDYMKDAHGVDLLESDMQEIENIINFSPLYWKILKDKFFKECTVKDGGIVRINLAPHDLFQWFKQQLVNR